MVDQATESFLASVAEEIRQIKSKLRSIASAATPNLLFTAGSVLFAGTLGYPAQDNANFFWDDTNNRLGIGTASPQAALHVIPGAKEAIRISSGTSGRGSSLMSYGTGSGDALYMSANAYYDGSNWQRIETGASVWLVDFGPSSGDAFTIQRAPSGSNPISAYTSLLTMDNAGNINIGASTLPATLEVARGAAANGTAVFHGTTYASHFNYSTAEDTYIRGGKSGAALNFNDAHNGPVNMVGGGLISLGGTLNAMRSSGTAVFAMDGTTQGSALTIANNNYGTPFTTSKIFSGLVLISDNSISGDSALFWITGGGVTLLAGNTGVWTVTSGTANRANLFITGTEIRLENKLGGSVNFYVMGIRIRQA